MLCSVTLSLQAQTFTGEVYNESDQQIKTAKITDVVDITFISKDEYLKQKKNAESFIPISHKYQMQEKEEYYTLPYKTCPNHTIKLNKFFYWKHNTKTNIPIRYKYIGNILGQHLISKNYYEDVWTYEFVDIITGTGTGNKQLWFGNIPKVVERQSRIFDIYSSPTLFSGTSFKSIKFTGNKTKNFTQEFHVILYDWILNFKNPSSYFITTKNVIYAEVIDEKILSKFWNSKDYNTQLKYIRVKQKLKSK